MPGTTPFPEPVKSTADVEAAKLLSRSANGKPGKPLTKSNGRSQGGTKVSGRGATRTRGGSV
jgi:hypothetical protein